MLSWYDGKKNIWKKEKMVKNSLVTFDKKRVAYSFLLHYTTHHYQALYHVSESLVKQFLRNFAE